MAFKALLKFDQFEVPVVSYDVSLRQEVDMKGQATSEVKGGKGVVEIESSFEGIKEGAYRHMVDSFTKIPEVKLTFLKGDTDAVDHEYIFETVTVTGYKDLGDRESTKSQTILLTFHSNRLKLGNEEHDNQHTYVR